LTSPHGKTSLWRPRGPGGAPAGETGWTLDFDPDACLGPLERHKESLVVLDGLDFTCVYRPGSTGSIGHHGAIGALTGRDLRSASDRRATGPSIDTFVARHLKARHFLLTFPEGLGSWDANGESAKGYGSVSAAHRDLFAALTPPGAAQPTADRAAAARRKAEAASLAHLKAESTVLRARLAGPERGKLDAYVEALSLMEASLSQPAAPRGGGCAKPPVPPTRRSDDNDLDAPTRHKLAMDHVAAALACGLHRVATVHMQAGPFMPFLRFEGGGNPHVHNDVAHGLREGDVASVRNVSRIHRFYAQQVAYLVERLKAIPEGDGSLYDRTIILWTNELGDPAGHQPWNVPFVLAGGGGTYRRGRLLTFPGSGGARGETNAHNRLLTSLANQFGANVPVFGDPDLAGELPGLSS
jgi:hypothetical protein